MASTTQMCGVCNQRNINKPSIIWCWDCEEGLCRDCIEHHSLSRGTRQHNIVSISQYTPLPTHSPQMTQNPGRKDIQVALPQFLSVQNINLKLLKTVDTVSHHIRGCCILPDDKMAFTFYSDKYVVVFNANTTKDFEVKTKTLVFDIAYVSNNNTLVATSGGSGVRGISIIDLIGKQLNKTIFVDSTYFGIAVKDDKLFCSALGKGIQLINQGNYSKNDIVRFKMPKFGYVATFGDKIYHTNHESNDVTCYDEQGTIQWRFMNESILKSPHGITVDNIGNIYVAGNQSNNVVVISADGQQHKEILHAGDGLFHPYSLDYNRSKNRLLVSHAQKKAFIFTAV